MKSNEFKNILDCMLRDQPVFIKGSPTRVKVTRLEGGRYHRNRLKTMTVNVEFIDVPTYTTLQLLENYSIYEEGKGNRFGLNSSNSNTSIAGKDFKIAGTIKIIHLRSKPKDSKAGAILYGR